MVLELQALFEERAEGNAPVPMNFFLLQNGSAVQGRALVACFGMFRNAPGELLFVFFVQCNR